MEFKDVILKRTSIRKYSEEKITDKEINELMIAAMCAPSAMDSRPWEFYIVKSENKLKELQKEGSSWANYNAPLAIVTVCNLDETLKEPFTDFWIQDLSAATENILLKATDLGLGSVWSGVYPIEKNINNVKRILGLNDNKIPFNIILIGHPLTNNNPKDKYDKNRIHII